MAKTYTVQLQKQLTHLQVYAGRRQTQLNANLSTAQVASLNRILVEIQTYFGTPYKETP